MLDCGCMSSSSSTLCRWITGALVLAAVTSHGDGCESGQRDCILSSRDRTELEKITWLNTCSIVLKHTRYCSSTTRLNLPEPT
ncbi:hypothetical protein C8Q80DRAFT_335938 [Daedaleopsis nitida]|nr:hypothetical protein C8Q80DRAFT_335938 [Daedaleopsis nitida]